MFTHIPQIVHGIDVATTSTKDNAFPVGISVVTIDVATLQVFGCISVFADHEDPKAKKVFDYSDASLSWWKGSKENSPSKLAYDLTFNAEFKVLIPDALRSISDYLGQWKKYNQTVASKTPSFDTTVLINACNICDVPMSLLGFHTLVDSAHTALRSMMFMGFEPNLANESKAWTKGRSFIEHFAPHEAGEAGYVTARLYHLLYLQSIDHELAKEAAELMKDGKYNYTEFSLKHKTKLVKGE